MCDLPQICDVWDFSINSEGWISNGYKYLTVNEPLTGSDMNVRISRNFLLHSTIIGCNCTVGAKNIDSFSSVGLSFASSHPIIFISNYAGQFYRIYPIIEQVIKWFMDNMTYLPGNWTNYQWVRADIIPG